MSRFANQHFKPRDVLVGAFIFCVSAIIVLLTVKYPIAVTLVVLGHFLSGFIGFGVLNGNFKKQKANLTGAQNPKTWEDISSSLLFGYIMWGILFRVWFNGHKARHGSEF